MGKVDLSVIDTKTEPIVFEYTWQASCRTASRPVRSGPSMPDP